MLHATAICGVTPGFNLSLLPGLRRTICTLYMARWLVIESFQLTFGLPFHFLKAFCGCHANEKADCQVGQLRNKHRLIMQIVILRMGLSHQPIKSYYVE